MRVSNLSWALCTTMLVASAAQADGADRPFGVLDDSPRFMLYIHKQVGTARHKSIGPSFGFAVDRSTSIWSYGDSSVVHAATARIFDLRVAPFDDNAIFLNGLQLTGNTARGLGYEGSYGEGSFGEGTSWNSPWLWGAVIIGGALGISCLTDNFPCDDNYQANDDYRVPGE